MAVPGRRPWRALGTLWRRSIQARVVLSTVVLYMFGRTCEGSWGSRDFTRFFLLSTVGGAALAIPANEEAKGAVHVVEGVDEVGDATWTGGHRPDASGRPRCG